MNLKTKAKSKRKFVFLDFDGPLNTGRSDYMDPDRYGHHFDEVAVCNLRRIIEKTGAKIVVSSSWRHMGIEKIKKIWIEWSMPGEIIGCTPGLWGDGRLFNSRGEEIQQWLEENAENEYVYVIIDDMDDSEANEEQKEYWIQVDPGDGISYCDANKAIDILNHEERKNQRKWKHSSSSRRK